MPLPDSLRGLLDKGTYPHPCERIELIETHISWVMLTGLYAYKLKRPVQFSFLDFSTLERREYFCREELRCNNAFAPALYIDVVPVYQHTDGSISIGGEPDLGEPVLEWAVKMHQFPTDAQLDRLLEHDAVTTNMLAAFGRALAAQHAALPQLTRVKKEAKQRILEPVDDNFAEIATTGLQLAHEPLLDKLHERTTALGRSLLPLLEDRMQNGWVRECHGDLHLSNLALIHGKVTAFDCLEFNPGLRWIDTLSDVAFLFMDCHERGRSDLAYAFLDGYLDYSGDYGGVQLLGYYAAYRSMVRAKVATLRWEQSHSSDAESRFINHIQWAMDWLARPCGTLVLMCGLSGAGKSYVAERLVPALPAIRLRSDVARKTIAGLSVQAKTESPEGDGLYKPGRSEAVFARLAQVAEVLLCGGDNVIIDATFIQHARRESFLKLAQKLGVKARIIHCDAPINVLKKRIIARSASDNDPSEATLEVLDLQLAKFEPPRSPEPVIHIDTAQALGLDALNSLVVEVKKPDTFT